MKDAARRVGIGFTTVVLIGTVLLVIAAEASPPPPTTTHARQATEPPPMEQSQPPQCVSDELLVKFQPGADPAAVSARHGATVKDVIGGIEVFVLGVPAGTVNQKVLEFQADPEVVYAEPNGIVGIPEDPPTGSPCD